MKFSYKTMFIGLMILAMSFVVIAATQLDQRRPTEFTTLTSESVVFNISFNQTDSSHLTFNVTLYNSTTSATANFSSVTGGMSGKIVNGSVWEVNVTMPTGIRVWWYVNITNGSGTSSDVPVISGVKLFDVDTAFLKFKLGSFDTLNFTLNTGDVDFANNITSNVIRLRNVTGARFGASSCTAGRAGEISYNGTFIGCDGTSWIKLSNGTAFT